MATALKVTVAPERISLRPGESADVELTIQNASQVVEHFSATVVGLPSTDLFTCEPDVVKLRPREVGTLRMQISVPERGGLVAGPYTLGLVVKSPYSQEVSRCEELPLDVQPAPALTMSVQPEVATGGKVGHYGVNLSNDGNMPMAVTLSGTDPENRVGFKFEPREIRLEPGMATGANITVNSDPPLTGQDIRRSVTLRANAGETTVEKPLTFVQRPRIKGGMMKFGALAAGLAVLGGLTYGGARMMRDLKTSNTAAQSPLQQTQIQPTQPQVPPTQAPPPASASAPPASAAQPSGGPSQPPPASGNAVPNNANVQTSFFIDFTQNPATKQPLDANTPISPDLWGTFGLSLLNITSRVTQPECKDAKLQSIRTVLPSNPPKYKISGAGTFLTTQLPTDIQKCSAVPVKMQFEKPLTAVKVFFTGLQTTNYVASVQFQDGTTKDIAQTGPLKIGESSAIGYQVEPNGKPIISVTFGHDPALTDNQDTVTMLRGVGITTVP
jgi:hypothetical protein